MIIVQGRRVVILPAVVKGDVEVIDVVTDMVNGEGIGMEIGVRIALMIGSLG